MELTVRQSLLLVVPRAEERLLTLCAHKVLDVPGLAERVHDAFPVDRPATSTTDRDPHLVMAAQAVQLLVQLPGVRLQLNSGMEFFCFYCQDLYDTKQILL